jgi:hypothetical protein
MDERYTRRWGQCSKVILAMVVDVAPVGCYFM